MSENKKCIERIMAMRFIIEMEKSTAVFGAEWTVNSIKDRHKTS